MLSGLDILILSVLAYNALVGFKRGFVRIIFDISALFLSFFLALKYHTLLSAIVLNIVPVSDNTASILGVFLMIVLVSAFIFALNRIATRVMDLTGLGLINRFGGFVLGTAKGLVIVTPIVIGLTLFNGSVLGNSRLLTPSHPIVVGVVGMTSSLF